MCRERLGPSQQALQVEHVLSKSEQVRNMLKNKNYYLERTITTQELSPFKSGMRPAGKAQSKIVFAGTQVLPQPAEAICLIAVYSGSFASSVPLG